MSKSRKPSPGDSSSQDLMPWHESRRRTSSRGRSTLDGGSRSVRVIREGRHIFSSQSQKDKSKGQTHLGEGGREVGKPGVEKTSQRCWDRCLVLKGLYLYPGSSSSTFVDCLISSTPRSVISCTLKIFLCLLGYWQMVQMSTQGTSLAGQRLWWQPSAETAGEISFHTGLP